MICAPASDNNRECDRCDTPITDVEHEAGLGYCKECFRARQIPPRSRHESQSDPSPWQENVIRDLEETRAGSWLDEA